MIQKNKLHIYALPQSRCVHASCSIKTKAFLIFSNLCVYVVSSTFVSVQVCELFQLQLCQDRKSLSGVSTDKSAGGFFICIIFRRDVKCVFVSLYVVLCFVKISFSSLYFICFIILYCLKKFFLILETWIYIRSSVPFTIPMNQLLCDIDVSILWLIQYLNNAAKTGHSFKLHIICESKSTRLSTSCSREVLEWSKFT